LGIVCLNLLSRHRRRTEGHVKMQHSGTLVFIHIKKSRFIEFTCGLPLVESTHFQHHFSEITFNQRGIDIELTSVRFIKGHFI
jgi:hypothetical protein